MAMQRRAGPNRNQRNGPVIADEERGPDVEEDEQLQINDINLLENTSNSLAFRKWPLSLWAVGTFIIVAALYLLYHVALGSMGVLFRGYREGYWWQYLIALGLIALGVAFLYAGKLHTVAFDKTKGALIISKKTIICRSKENRYRLSDIINIKAYKKGHGGVNVYTLHYVIQAEI